jgi:hypothetical protein
MSADYNEMAAGRRLSFAADESGAVGDDLRNLTTQHPSGPGPRRR